MCIRIVRWAVMWRKACLGLHVVILLQGLATCFFIDDEYDLNYSGDNGVPNIVLDPGKTAVMVALENLQNENVQLRQDLQQSHSQVMALVKALQQQNSRLQQQQKNTQKTVLDMMSEMGEKMGKKMQENLEQVNEEMQAQVSELLRSVEEVKDQQESAIGSERLMRSVLEVMAESDKETQNITTLLAQLQDRVISTEASLSRLQVEGCGCPEQLAAMQQKMEQLESLLVNLQVRPSFPVLSSSRTAPTSAPTTIEDHTWTSSSISAGQVSQPTNTTEGTTESSTPPSIIPQSEIEAHRHYLLNCPWYLSTSFGRLWPDDSSSFWFHHRPSWHLPYLSYDCLHRRPFPSSKPGSGNMKPEISESRESSFLKSTQTPLSSPSTESLPASSPPSPLPGWIESSTMDNNAVTNVALNKPVLQSTYHSLYGQPEKAVDGSKVTTIDQCTHTANIDSNPHRWWRVDLMGLFEVEAVVITNRGDCCGYRLSNFNIYVMRMLSDPSEKRHAPSDLCVHHSGQIADGATVRLECSQPIVGQYVSLVLPTDAWPLNVCELEVLGRPAPAVTNVALNKPALQSTYHLLYGEPERAVDGIKATAINHCTHTADIDSNPHRWWRVDLMGLFEVEAVVITNRGDCCGYRLSDFNIYVMQTLSDPSEKRHDPRDLCLHHSGQIADGATVRLECSQPIVGQYVSLVLPTDAWPLNFCELEVLGRPAPEGEPKPTTESVYPSESTSGPSMESGSGSLPEDDDDLSGDSSTQDDGDDDDNQAEGSGVNTNA